MNTIVNLDNIVINASNNYIANNSNDFQGNSTYEVAVDNGFVGTEAEWLTYLEVQSRLGNTSGNTTNNTANNTVGNTNGNTTGNTENNTTNNTNGNTVGNTEGNNPLVEWSGTSLRFTTNDEHTEWTPWVDLKGQQAYSDAEIKTKYEANADTNAFTDAKLLQLDNNTTNIDLNSQAIANLATAQGSIQGTQTTGYVFDPINTNFTQLPIDEIIPSTDSNIFEIDDVSNTVTFKTNASYNFFNTLVVESATNSQKTVEFRLVNTADSSIVYSRTAEIETLSGNITSLEMLGLLTIGKGDMPSAPVTLRMECREVDQSYSMISFNSVITSSSSYDVSTVHNGLSGRDVIDSHPASAISVLDVDGYYTATDVEGVLKEIVENNISGEW